MWITWYDIHLLDAYPQ